MEENTPADAVNVLLSGFYWSSNVIGYFFAASLSDYRYRNPAFLYGFQPVGASHQHAVQNILEGTYRPSLHDVEFGRGGDESRPLFHRRQPVGDRRRSVGFHPDPTWVDPKAGASGPTLAADDFQFV